MFRFISVGGDCQTASQINRFARSGVTRFFDVISIPIDRATRLIDNDFPDLLLEKNLHPVYNEQKLGRVIDTLNRIDIGHEFTAFTSDEIARIQERYKLRARWFRELFGPDAAPSYFVQRWHPRDGDEDEGRAVALHALLRSRRPDTRFLYLHEDPARPDRIEDGFRSTYLAPPATPHWQGNNEAWRRALGTFAFRAANRDEADSGFSLPAKIGPRFG